MATNQYNNQNVNRIYTIRSVFSQYERNINNNEFDNQNDDSQFVNENNRNNATIMNFVINNLPCILLFLKISSLTVMSYFIIYKS